MRVYQLETTNYCNAKCEYCPHSSMTREKGFVSLETVQKVIDNCLYTNQNYIALHHMGEPFLHPQLKEIVSMFTDNGIKTEFSSNGLILTHDKLIHMNNAGLSLLRIAIDYKYEEKNNKILTALFKFYHNVQNPSLRISIHTVEGNDLSMYKDFPVELLNKPKDNWAGQIEGESTLTKSSQCYFLDYNYGVVLWDGRIVNCCLDADAEQVIGTIDDIRNISTKPFKLCENCVKLQFAEGGGWTK